MKLVTLTTVGVLLSAGYALAGGGAPVPATPEGGAPSGRPSAILNDAKCASAWSLTQRDGDTLSGDQAAPFIVNFKLVDADGDGKISEAEFKDGCKMGLVQEASAEGSQKPTGKASPAVPKE